MDAATRLLEAEYNTAGRMRTREGMKVAKVNGKLRGKQPKLSAANQRRLCQIRGTGEHTITDLAETFSVSRATVYRVLAAAAAT